MLTDTNRLKQTLPDTPEPCQAGKHTILAQPWKTGVFFTWTFWDIKISKPPYISSLKMVGFVHFSNFFIPSEKYYKLQSCWITLYQIFSVATSSCPKSIFFHFVILLSRCLLSMKFYFSGVLFCVEKNNFL